ncbi:uncharacterized protein [Prorops nasuta]|uniref:uncharacterized protein n=1 Tax=Prorops nasuta TaxID=863751 RepID=UPI0034CED2B7
MAFFQLILKARKLEKARLIYEDEKLKSIEISEGAKPHYTFQQKLRRQKLRCKRKTKELLRKVTTCPEGSWFHRRAVMLRTDGTFENYIFKSLLGFLGGIFLTYLFFMFFVFQLNFTLQSATLLCSIFGIILTLGLAFSYRVRCIVFLLLPQFFSKRGRQALMAYAFILALTGPAKNTLHNTGVLSESLACGQKQLKDAVKAVVDLIKQPFYALKEAITKVIKTVKLIVKRIKQTLIAIKRVVLSILRVIKSVFEWLGSIVNICNKKLGTPFDRCQRVFEGAVADCKAKLGPFFGGICNLTYVVSALCYIVKPLDFICMLVSYVADAIVDTVRKKIRKFTKRMKAMFYVKIQFSHSFHFETNQSKSLEEVSTGIVTEIRSRTDKFLTVFDWMSFGTSFFVVFMLLRVIHYRHKWLTNERFDNRYLTEDLRTIDLIRCRQDKETVLPLNRRERNKYIPLTSMTLVRMEKVKLARSAVFLALATFKLCIHMLADYSLYWILSTIRYHGRFETKVQRPNSVGLYVSGTGYLAELYRSIAKAFTPHAKDMEIDSIPCLPDPIPPDFDRYTQIVSLIVLCWLMAIFEPYGLRLRHVVMSYYHPDRAKQRATWLYNHIIRSRGSFLKFARRQLRRKFGMAGGDRIEGVTVKQRLAACCPLLHRMFDDKLDRCLMCGMVQRPGEETHVKCVTPDCLGFYCLQCYADLGNLCTICKMPIEYGDLSDMSEERDSSDDQLARKVERLMRESKDKEGEQRKKRDEKLEDVESKKKSSEEEDDEVLLKDEANQTDKGFEEATGSSESLYSYTYQEESPEEGEDTVHKRLPFRDLEAQNIRDDVTIQIFNQLAKEEESSSEGPTSCFVVRARRRLKTKTGRDKQRKRCVCPTNESSSSSGSTRTSDSSEEVDEEEVVHVEVEDSSCKLVSGENKEHVKQNRTQKIIQALSKVPWLRKNEEGISGDFGSRPSLMRKIIGMLKSGKSKGRVQTYRRVGNRKRGEEKNSSSSSCDETCAFLTAKEKVDPGFNIYSKNYDSHRTRRRFLSKPDDVDLRNFNDPLEHAKGEKLFSKKHPRYSETASRNTRYYEINEIGNDGRRRGEKMNINLSIDTKTQNIEDGNHWNIPTDKNLEDSSEEISKSSSEVETKEDENSQSSTDRDFVHKNRMQGGADTEDGKTSETVNPDIYDPLAGLELYGVQYQRRKRLTGKEENTNFEEFKKSTRTLPVATVDKATDLPDKSRAVQTKLLKQEERIEEFAKKKINQEYPRKRNRNEYNEPETSEIPTVDKGRCLRKKCWRRKHQKRKRTCSCSRCRKGKTTRRRESSKCVCSVVRSKERIVMCSRSVQNSQIELREKGMQCEWREPIMIECPREREESDERLEMDFDHRKVDCRCIYRSSVCHEDNCPFFSQRCHPLYQKLQEGPMRGPKRREYFRGIGNPKLIEELKKREVVKKIAKCGVSRMAQTPREMWMKPEMKDEACSYSSMICHAPETDPTNSDEEKTLPYQETNAFRKVVREFRNMTDERNKKDRQSLISFSKRADKMKDVQQLFPKVEQMKRANILSRFKDRVTSAINPLGVSTAKKLEEFSENSDFSETEPEKVSLLKRYPCGKSRIGNLSTHEDTTNYEETEDQK